MGRKFGKTVSTQAICWRNQKPNNVVGTASLSKTSWPQMAQSLPKGLDDPQLTHRTALVETACPQFRHVFSSDIDSSVLFQRILGLEGVDRSRCTLRGAGWEGRAIRGFTTARDCRNGRWRYLEGSSDGAGGSAPRPRCGHKRRGGCREEREATTKALGSAVTRPHGGRTCEGGRRVRSDRK